MKLYKKPDRNQTENAIFDAVSNVTVLLKVLRKVQTIYRGKF